MMKEHLTGICALQYSEYNFLKKVDYGQKMSYLSNHVSFGGFSWGRVKINLLHEKNNIPLLFARSVRPWQETIGHPTLGYRFFESCPFVFVRLYCFIIK
jgi:hypothetical protein